ncbi:tRNA synthetases class I (C) catalytic domain-containing protein [Amanita rubescens]|nr:tRNA synthetases class I (C) catalytic domain-containing protein [Amanita rubescens]
MSIQQPPWSLPTPLSPEPSLKVYNSLTRTKTDFVPKDGRLVKWYNCGPTVYDASHMGHARNYVSQDILRRIMTDYFGYDVHFVMNITDIDDKIIERARQNHLFDQFKADLDKLSPALVSQVEEAWLNYLKERVSRGLPPDMCSQVWSEETWSTLDKLVQDVDWKRACLSREEKFDMYFSATKRSFVALQLAKRRLGGGECGLDAAYELVEDSKDVLTRFLDSQYKSTVTDPSISRQLAAYWEQKFFQDMDRLKVRRPDVVTRVTEYVPEIVAFVEGIMKNGYAYEAEGSVYFDTLTFDKTEIHHYAKLEPWSKGNRELLEEGEGALATKAGRRSPSDFALWKASKPGEPSWPSPWGPGRPGWHIECSVMASAILGSNLDIHSGGIDLAFPHHDNEMAQSEAYHECESWVNYFLHTGHLHIEGLKMSKSLKNFITIDETLQRYSARQLRLAFLTQTWNAKVDFSESLMTGEVRNIEQTLNNFFTVVRALIHQSRSNASSFDGSHRNNEPEKTLNSRFCESQKSFRTALCDSFNTPLALDVLRELVSRTNVYINTQGSKVNVDLLEAVAQWISRMLRMFGLGEDNGAVNTLSSFRDGVRRAAISKNENALRDILVLCDKLRDVDLVPLGVALDDQEDGKALVKLVPPAELIKARDEKRAIQEAKTAKKAAHVEAERQKKLLKLEKGRLAAEEMFKPPHTAEGTYGTWDDQGIPLTDSEGKELSKNQAKKVRKLWEDQRKLHEEFLVWQKSESG